MHEPTPPETPNITTIRRKNLLLMLKEFSGPYVAEHGSSVGVEVLFAEHLQLSHSRLSQIKGSRPIGDKVARQLEATTGRPIGWLDESHPDQAPLPGEVAFLAIARQVWLAQKAKGKRSLAKVVKDFQMSGD